MKDMIKMVVVLTVLAAFSGGLLAAIRDNTIERIENQQLTFVKGPAIKEIMAGSKNDPIADRFKIQVGEEEEKSVFVGVFDGKSAVAIESYGKGYGGDVGVMVGIDLATDKILGLSVTTHAETPGMGAMAKDDPVFAQQFKGMATDKPIMVSNDGGTINIISGATITSRAVSSAATRVAEMYHQKKPEIEQQVQAFK